MLNWPKTLQFLQTSHNMTTRIIDTPKQEMIENNFVEGTYDISICLNIVSKII